MSQLGVTRAGDSHAHPWKCMYKRSPPDYWSNSFVFPILYVSHISLTTKSIDMLWVLQMHLIHVVHVRKEAGIVISDLAPYYPACFTDASLALLPYNMISKIVWHIFVKLFHGMCQSLEAISWVFSAFHFLSSLFSYSNGMSTLSYNNVWNQFISANSIITCHFTISPVFHIYLPVMCICYYKENSRKSFIMLHNIVTFFEKLWRLILHILYTEVLSLNTKD